MTQTETLELLVGTYIVRQEDIALLVHRDNIPFFFHRDSVFN